MEVDVGRDNSKQIIKLHLKHFFTCGLLILASSVRVLLNLRIAHDEMIC